MRKPLIAGNWKMNKTNSEAAEFAFEMTKSFKNYDKRDILIIPSFIALKTVSEIIEGTPILLGAQNFYPEKSGAFTGEVSYTQLLEAGCSYVLVGHSERRQYFKEDNNFLNQKVKVAIEKGLSPILCIGETLEERKNNQTKDVLKKQIQEGLAGLSPELGRFLTIAYEPIWAIGTGLTAQNEDIQTNHAFIRGLIFDLFDGDTAENTRILYGGSVKPSNVSGIMAQRDVDGALVGGASLKTEDFASLVNYE